MTVTVTVTVIEREQVTAASEQQIVVNAVTQQSVSHNDGDDSEVCKERQNHG